MSARKFRTNNFMWKINPNWSIVTVNRLMDTLLIFHFYIPNCRPYSSWFKNRFATFITSKLRNCCKQVIKFSQIFLWTVDFSSSVFNIKVKVCQKGGKSCYRCFRNHFIDSKILKCFSGYISWIVLYHE